MANFVVGTPVETTESTVEVTVDVNNPLPVGRHKLQLIVVDQEGNQSLPDVVEVIVKDTENPTAVLKAPPQVEFGRSFILDGRESTDVPPGKVVKYIWTRLD